MCITAAARSLVISLTRAMLRLVWPSLLLQSTRGRIATAAKTVIAHAAMERHARKTLIKFFNVFKNLIGLLGHN